MPQAFSTEQVAHYRDQGWLSPLDFLSADEAASARASLAAFETEHGPLSGRSERSRAYLPFAWVNDLMRDPGLLDMVEDLIGPDISVRGQDRFGHFDHAPQPPTDLDPATMEYHARSAEVLREIVYQGSDTAQTKL